MASIAEWIEKIKTAIYGEEVRGAIWQSLDAMNTQVDAINVDSAQIEQNKQNIATNTAAITALNSSLTTAEGTPTVPSGCTLVYGGYWVFGKWVFLDAIVTVDETKTAYNPILGDIPSLYTPGTSTPISACVNNAPCAAMVSNSNVYVGRSIASISAGATVRITGCYRRL